MTDGGARCAGLAVVLAAIVLVGVPVAELLAAAADGATGAARLGMSRAVVQAVVNTSWTAVAVTVSAVLLGGGAALVTERTLAPAVRALRLVVLVPLLVPGFVAALSWGRAYGPGGLLDDVLGASMPGLFGPAGVVAVLTVEAMPVAYLVVAAALRGGREADAERAARVSGAGPATVLRTITLPLLRPALVAAAALVLISAVNAFGVPAVLGLPAGFLVGTTRIYADFALAADPAAFSRALALSVGLVVLALLVVAAADLSGAGHGVRRPGGPTAAARRSAARWPGALLWAYLLVAVAVPLVALVLVALTRAVGLPTVPANWTAANFREAVDPAVVAAFARSVWLAAAAAVLVVVLGGLVTALHRHPGGRGAATLAALPFAVPGSALAVAMLLAYGSWLRDTAMLLVMAYTAKFWALGHRSLAGAADALPADTTRAARASGANPLTALRTVVAPLLLPALATGWLVVFLFGLHELTMSSLLYGPGAETLAVVILNRAQVGDVTVTSALAVLLTAAVLVPAPALLLTRRGRERWGA